MVQELLPILPQWLSNAGVAVALAGLLLGAAIWLVGARYRRGIVTLICVGVGGMLGVMLTRWEQAGINSMAATVGGAVGFGMIGYAFHRIWVGVLLGLLLACWAVAGCWIVRHGEAKWEWPTDFQKSTKPLPQYAREDLW